VWRPRPLAADHGRGGEGEYEGVSPQYTKTTIRRGHCLRRIFLSFQPQQKDQAGDR
jgi:hypothetical protein